MIANWENTNPQMFTNVDVFVGDWYYNPADVVLENFTWSSDNKKHLDCAATDHCSTGFVCIEQICGLSDWVPFRHTNKFYKFVKTDKPLREGFN